MQFDAAQARAVQAREARRERFGRNPVVMHAEAREIEVEQLDAILYSGHLGEDPEELERHLNASLAAAQAAAPMVAAVMGTFFGSFFFCFIFALCAPLIVICCLVRLVCRWTRPKHTSYSAALAAAEDGRVGGAGPPSKDGYWCPRSLSD